MEAKRMSVDEMEAGEALDELVAERVMGMEIIDHPKLRGRKTRFIETGTAHGLVTLDDGRTGTIRNVPQFSRSISDAWDVVEKLREGSPVRIVLEDVDGPESGNDHWWASVTFSMNGERWMEAAADTAPHAICLAALKAVRETTVERARRAGL